MNTKKRIDGDYYIETINADDRVYIQTNSMELDGNLTVSGNITYINTETLDIKDPFIVLNSSNTATYAANSGILTHKTASSFAGIRYNTVDGRWELSTATSDSGETGTWTEIGTASAGAVAGPNTASTVSTMQVLFGGESRTLPGIKTLIHCQLLELLVLLAMLPLMAQFNLQIRAVLLPQLQIPQCYMQAQQVVVEQACTL